MNAHLSPSLPSLVLPLSPSFSHTLLDIPIIRKIGNLEITEVKMKNGRSRKIVQY
jgi:hypothetical protein